MKRGWLLAATHLAALGIGFAAGVYLLPVYKLYLAPEYVDTKEAFLRIKGRALRVGEVKTFDNFIVALANPADLERFTTVVVWCETFSMFISAARYR